MVTSSARSQFTIAHGKLLLAVALTPKEVGERIKLARDAKGWTQLEFALEAHVSPSSVTRWESGKLPPVRELMRIAALLGVEPEDLVEEIPSISVREDRLVRLESQLETVLDLCRDLKAELVALTEDRQAPPEAPAQDG